LLTEQESVAEGSNIGFRLAKGKNLGVRLEEAEGGKSARIKGGKKGHLEEREEKRGKLRPTVK